MPDLHSLVEISALHMEQDAELLLFVHFAAGVSIRGGLLVHERSGSKSNGNKKNVTDKIPFPSLQKKHSN